MPRYRTKLWWEEIEVNNLIENIPESLTVDIAEPRDTGLLDSRGNKIFEFQDKVGYVRFEDTE